MIPLFYPNPLYSVTAPRPGPLLRELSARQDRLPQEQRIDLPEIQESFRVSFSDEARAASTFSLRDDTASQPEAISAQLRAYRRIAAL